MLQEKALHFKREIEVEDGEFTAIDSWLDRWNKNRYMVFVNTQ